MRRSTPRRAIDIAVACGQLLASEATIQELEEVLRRPTFKKYVSEQARLEFLAALVDQSEVVRITFHTSECRDAKDNKFLELAVSGRATHIISGDGDLLVLSPFRGIAIISPEEFLRSFDEQQKQEM